MLPKLSDILRQTRGKLAKIYASIQICDILKLPTKYEQNT